MGNDTLHDLDHEFGDNMSLYYYDSPLYFYYDDDIFLPSSPGWSCDALCVFILMVCILISILGVLGNGLVIWIILLKTKRSVNSSWYFSLAVSDLLLCSTLPFNCAYWIAGQWHFGGFMCKFINMAMPLNMYSSIYLLVIVSVDRCICVILPVWSQNHRTLRGSSVVIVAAWILATALSLHNLVFYATNIKNDIIFCDHNGTSTQKKTFVAIGFIFGLALPLLLIVICYAIIMQKLKVNRMTRSPKPFRLMTAVIITFVICWLPYQTFRLLGVSQVSNIKTGIQISIMLAYANSVMNPVLYSFMGQDFRNRCLRSICARMENTLHQEDQSTKAIPMSISAHSPTNSN